MKETKLNLFIFTFTTSSPCLCSSREHTGLQLLMLLAFRNESLRSGGASVYWCTITIIFFVEILCSSCWHSLPTSPSFKREVMIFCQQDTRQRQYPGLLQASIGSACLSFVLVWSIYQAALSEVMARNRFHQHYLSVGKTIILCYQTESVCCFISLFFFINVGFSSLTACTLVFTLRRSHSQ